MNPHQLIKDSSTHISKLKLLIALEQNKIATGKTYDGIPQTLSEAKLELRKKYSIDISDMTNLTYIQAIDMIAELEEKLLSSK